MKVIRIKMDRYKLQYAVEHIFEVIENFYDINQEDFRELCWIARLNELGNSLAKKLANIGKTVTIKLTWSEYFALREVLTEEYSQGSHKLVNLLELVDELNKVYQNYLIEHNIRQLLCRQYLT